MTFEGQKYCVVHTKNSEIALHQNGRVANSPYIIEVLSKQKSSLKTVLIRSNRTCHRRWLLPEVSDKVAQYKKDAPMGPIVNDESPSLLLHTLYKRRPTS